MECNGSERRAFVHFLTIAFLTKSRLLTIGINYANISLKETDMFFAILVLFSVATLEGAPKRLTIPELQNTLADREGLKRYKNQTEVERATARGELVRIRNTRFVDIDDIPEWRQVCLPRTRDFVQDFGKSYEKGNTGGDVVVNSATRPATTQRGIAQGGNRNAAPTTGRNRSSHLTGATLDLAKLKMTPRGIRWSRKWLDRLQKKGFVVYRSERRQAVFHVFVTNKYTKGVLPNMIAAEKKPKDVKKPKPTKPKPARKHTRRGRS